ncbi:helix-turn-helix transcriptional regulator [Ilyomonas limi]|uniref:Helix-turn-helix transcriptional regulator n=1 Tax=Ilyomonas limi TaxID=2575867 RepID=A0A4U3KPG3_9BACT|nr:AraC family transcriptional regulator [Ilyomonas limi]TKK64078.1 helix-turn-helix transcriptional regulator [Ilyomonas limi]
MKLNIKSAIPDKSIVHFVHSFWMLENKTGKDVRSTVLPNGMVDLTLMNMKSGNWKLFLRGLDTEPSQVVIEKGTKIFTIGLKLLAVEYLLSESIKHVLNEAQHISNDFWQFEESDMKSLENFCNRATQKINTISFENIDSRKKKLFELIYSSNGSTPVKELSDQVFWSSRQINRYFNQQFGISLKAYCRLLRLGSSFKHISEGKLFPEQAFTDQNHFIKEVKKYAGVTPKELSKNKDDRFIDITAIKNFPS